MVEQGSGPSIRNRALQRYTHVRQSLSYSPCLCVSVVGFLREQFSLRRIHSSCQFKVCFLGYAGQMNLAEEERTQKALAHGSCKIRLMHLSAQHGAKMPDQKFTLLSSRRNSGCDDARQL